MSIKNAKRLSVSAVIISALVVLGACDDLNRTMPLNELHRAASNNDLEKIDAALLRGNDVDVTDEDGNTALHFAAFYGKVDAVQRLIQSGADVNRKDRSGRTPLHLAAPQRDGLVFYRKYGRSMKELLVAHARLNEQDVYGDTPLHRAVYWGVIENVRILKDWGADSNVRNYRNQTAADVAREHLQERINRRAEHEYAGRTDFEDYDREEIRRHREMLEAVEANATSYYH